MNLVGKSIAGAMAECAEQVERMMDLLLPKVEGNAEAPLVEAMRYSSLGGGKRLRPFIVLQSAQLFGVDPRCAIRVGAAVEFMHCYSLIHDDLPAMDNSDLRRGKPSCHKQFDEATAILAGDALQALAFQILASPETHADAIARSELVMALARAAGMEGMTGGQMIDLLAETRELNIGAITRLQRMKTGDMFTFCATSGAIMGRGTERQFHALNSYAQGLGLAFQIADDLLDFDGKEQDTGKPTGQDVKSGKATFVSTLGPERARFQARLLSEQAGQALDFWGEPAALLRAVACFVVNRDR
ncbi:MAG: farnesyl-diphosphate synthase [Rhodospirillaceae bacterium]|nr:farnesyl-diphosphate synthase [Rhodospirillaceae bacterium]